MRKKKLLRAFPFQRKSKRGYPPENFLNRLHGATWTHGDVIGSLTEKITRNVSGQVKPENFRFMICQSEDEKTDLLLDGLLSQLSQEEERFSWTVERLGFDYCLDTRIQGPACIQGTKTNLVLIYTGQVDYVDLMLLQAYCNPAVNKPSRIYIFAPLITSETRRTINVLYRNIQHLKPVLAYLADDNSATDRQETALSLFDDLQQF